MSKLSNSILSLKFMQNAQRAKQQKEVEIERAKVKDEAEWEVPKEVREGWGQTSSTSAVSLEDSYLPFLYPVLETAGAEAPIKGRRRYKNGELVKEEIPEVPTPSEEATASTSKAEDPSSHDSPSRRDSDRSGKPKSGLSALKKRRKDSRHEATDDSQIPGNAKTVQDLIRENAGIGVDLRGARAAPAKSAPSPPVFLKPSGVDEPSKAPAASSTEKTEQSSDPTPSGKPTKKAKRKSEGDGESVKPKKKKRKEPAA
ncbi:uncharacterized protein SCHCODRAFT_02639442 [Schizophyllum commune H4-8]|uniref:Uncharacterized protein n=1 Tax=Schizophyllum commune (strain H4-8 / FGSC 9210) TaxID=578458 RepID=D8QGC2_SCHCM|nr:uncharacterized protein SCHCODRAFT_02639442 [Schizophyllum commune H4-8]KAI5887989.1 hypothetical protein SCHCODRAFT_02639442 [Schizophyllum commune H4-8]